MTEKWERQSRGMVKHGGLETVVWQEAAATDGGSGHCQEKLKRFYF